MQPTTPRTAGTGANKGLRAGGTFSGLHATADMRGPTLIISLLSLHVDLMLPSRCCWLHKRCVGGKDGCVCWKGGVDRMSLCCVFQKVPACTPANPIPVLLCHIHPGLLSVVLHFACIEGIGWQRSQRGLLENVTFPPTSTKRTGKHRFHNRCRGNRSLGRWWILRDTRAPGGQCMEAGPAGS